MDIHLRFNPAEDHPPAHAVVTDWLHGGFKDAAASVAIRFGEEAVTYEELDRRSTRIARYLSRCGVTPGGRVGLCLDRSIEMVAALIGILKAGAAYVPLDPDYPAERLAMMREDARMQGLLIHAAHAARFEAETAPVLVWEECASDIMIETDDPIDVDIDPEDAAYIIFTSGSTGRPKGIAMPHRALSNLIEWQLQRSSFKPGARVLQYSSISFDVSFQEIATTLASAGTLVLITNEERKDPRTLLSRLVEENVERLYLPYVAMRSMIEAAHIVGTCPESLKEVITAGEQLRVDDAVRLFFSRIGDATLDNQYGPSESHVITAHLLSGDPSEWPDLPPIGTPLINNRVFLLDDEMRPVDVGKEGELCLTGRNLAHGYLFREEQTRKAFVPNPFDPDPHSTLYKTGDLGTYDESGSIHYLGRKDHQVKIRGHRVEPGEINAAAMRHPGIRQCLTHAAADTDGTIQLLAYYIVDEAAEVDAAELRRYLSGMLPPYMVPAHCIEIDSVPVTPSGKADLKALPNPLRRRADPKVASGYDSETEAALAEIWSEVLSVADIPRTADFFDLGGDSLKAVSLFLKIYQRFGSDLALASLSRAPTIAELAVLIDQTRDVCPPVDYRALQIMHQGSNMIAPLVLMHGGLGNVLVYDSLVRNLNNDQTVYAFQWPGWDGRRSVHDVEGMARFYCEELQRVHAGGPVRLGGYCIGGLVALEMARLLREAGLEVLEPLIIWDSPNMRAGSYFPKEPWEEPPLMKRLESLKAELMRLAAPYSPGLSAAIQQEESFAGLSGVLKRIPGLHASVRQLKKWRAEMPAYAAWIRGKRAPMELRSLICVHRMERAMLRYDPSVYPGDIAYIRSSSILGRDMRTPGWWDDPFFGFRDLCGGTFDGYVVGGAHHEILESPHMAELIKIIFDKSLK